MKVIANASKKYPNSNEYDENTIALARNHINNKANPHSVTASQTGAAEKVHSHSEVFLSKKVGTVDLREYAQGSWGEIEITSNTIKNVSLFGDMYYKVPISVKGMMSISAVSRSNTCTIILNGDETNVVNGGKFDFIGNVDSLAVILDDGEVVFEQIEFLPSEAGFMTPEMLEKLLASLDRSTLENTLKDYITNEYVESNYYTKGTIDEKIDSVIADIDKAANAFEGSASGELIVLDDVSPIVHGIVVKTSRGTEVIACGKNMIPFPYPDFSYNSGAGVSVALRDDGGIALNGVATSNVFVVLVKGVKYSDVGILPNSKSGIITNGDMNGVYCRYDADNESTYVYIKSGVACDNLIFYPQMEVGFESTEYVKGSDVYVSIADKDGNAKIPSVYPVTTIVAKDDADVEYNKDLNKVFGDIDVALDMILAIQEQYLPAEVEVIEEADEGGEGA